MINQKFRVGNAVQKSSADTSVRLPCYETFFQNYNLPSLNSTVKVQESEDPNYDSEDEKSIEQRTTKHSSDDNLDCELDFPLDEVGSSTQANLGEPKFIKSLNTPGFVLSRIQRIEQDDYIDPVKIPQIDQSELKIEANLSSSQVFFSRIQPVQYFATINLSLTEPQKYDPYEAGKDIVLVIDHSFADVFHIVGIFQPILNKLSSRDRLSIFSTFEKKPKLTPFLCMNERNKDEVIRLIKQLYLNQRQPLPGVYKQALLSLQNRKQENNVASIVLITDDTYNLTLADFISTELKGSCRYIINTIGVGMDSDPILLQALADCNDGSYFYAQDFESIDVPVQLIISELDSIIAKRMTISLSIPNTKSFIKTKFLEIYDRNSQLAEPGHSFFMKKKYFSSKGLTLALQVEFPDYTHGEEALDLDWLDVTVSMAPLEVKKQSQEYKASFFIPFENISLIGINRAVNAQVYEIYYRFKYAKLLRKSLTLYANGFEGEAEKILENIIGDLSTLIVLENDKMKKLFSQARWCLMTLKKEDFKSSACHRLMISAMSMLDN